jgi:hypothetical protein
MSYSPVLVYTTDGTFVGYSIIGSEFKLQTTNLYSDQEQPQLQEQLERLNTNHDLRQTWPHPQDPEVQEIVNNPEWMPIEYIDAEMVDDEHSYYVWKQEPLMDENMQYVTNPVDGTIVMVQGTELDETASVIRYKWGKVPKNPSDQMLRLKAACEAVARRRAGLV